MTRTEADATARGLRYIASQQLPGGGFVSYSSPNKTSFSGALAYRTVFLPSLILSALADIGGTSAQKINSRIARFLLVQKSPEWTFNYWDRSSPKAIALPYPDDLDDTFCALSALARYKPSLLTGKVLAAVAHTLIRAEEKEGGPYRTWLADAQSEAVWRDTDIAVNANVAYFLSLQDIELTSIVGMVEAAITKENLQSPYYPNTYPIAYFIAHWYRGKKSKRLEQYILKQQPDGNWGNPLHTALAMSTLLRLGYPAKKLQPSLDYLLKTQPQDGSWPAAAFCIDPMRGNKTHYAGAPVLTTALCLEAIHLYEQALVPDKPAKTPAREPANPHYNAVKKEVSSTIAGIEHADLRDHTQTVLKRILKQDSDKQILLLPWFITAAAKVEVEEATLRQLSAASLWGWMAYTTYDDFLDNEGDIKLLPSANLCLRYLTGTLTRTLPDNAEFQDETVAIMNRVDAANAWEVSHCRGVIKKGRLHISNLPDYGELTQLADRSLGHTIAGLGVLYAAGHNGSSPSMRALRDYFKHYLIARQLNDDAHDWEEDLRAGHINAVGVLILQCWLAKGNSLDDGIDLKAQSNELKKIMWEEIIVDACHLIHHHIARARKALSRKNGNLNQALLDKLLQPPEAAANQALTKRTQTLDFITSL